MYNNIKWFRGCNYYKVRGWLEKNGYKKTSNYGYYNNEKTKGWQEFDSGTESIIIKCNIIRANNGNLWCDTVYDYELEIYDNYHVMMNYLNTLNEKEKVL